MQLHRGRFVLLLKVTYSASLAYQLVFDKLSIVKSFGGAGLRARQ